MRAYEEILIFIRYIGAVYGEKIVQELENNLPKGNKDEFQGIYLELLAESGEIMKQLTKSLNKTPDLKLIEQYGKKFFLRELTMFSL